ncbi:MAG: hypothetical protein GY903_01010 [Fuerstiella sp.]|nr:hypothetical protein [Fuerstiella sp.]MCP4853057.1 hypothetical protein [Fuerstiella sp.]
MSTAELPNRTDQIMTATDTLIRAHQHWQDSDQPAFSSDLEEAISAAISVVMHGGDFPAECVRLVQPFVHFGEAWMEVLDGRGIDTDGLPVPAFWAAFEAVKAAHKQIREAGARANTLEPVADLLEQFGKDPRKYEWVAKAYAIQQSDGSYEGPFFDEFGQVLTVLIKKEAAEPGSVVPDSSVLTAAAQRQRSSDEGQKRLDSLRSKFRAMNDIEPEDPATIEELLTMGQYPDVIARGKRCSLDNVFTEAARLGITPANREADLMVENVNPIEDAYDAAAEGTSGDKPAPELAEDRRVFVADVKPSAPKKLETITGDDLAEKILSLAADDADLDSVSAARQLGEAGYTASLDDITEALNGLHE